MKNHLPWLLAVLAVFYFRLPAAGSDQNLPEPENIGTIYYFDSSTNSLVALEKEIATAKREGWPKQKIIVQVAGGKADLRLKADQKMEFVVSLANGVDPGKYQLIAFETKDGNRQAITMEATWTGKKANPVFHPFNIRKFGDAYKLTPSPALPSGEYGFSPNDSNDVFCFGVDAVPDGGKK